jgi:phosphatidylinositol alpha-1,6-mannosyltransferase
MRIGVVSPEFPPALGGVETYAWQFCQELVRRGHDVTVFTSPQREGRSDLPGGRVLPILRRRRRHDLKTLRTQQVDVWHIMNTSYAWLALDVNQPVVVSAHGNDFLRPYILTSRMDLFQFWRPLQRLFEPLDKKLGVILGDRVMRRALPQARHILCNSRYTEQALLARIPACQGKTSTAWVGVAKDFFSIEPSPRQDAIPHLLTISRLSEPRKNVALILRALAVLKARHDFRYTVVGDGVERVALQSLAQQHGLEERVRFMGKVDHDELRKHLSESDLFVLTASINPYSHEGFGIVYLEANAAGVPVLAARLAGAAEAVDESVSGFFVEDPTVPALTDALDAFLTRRIRFDPQACRQHARRFDWACVVDQAEIYYDSGLRT